MRLEALKTLKHDVAVLESKIDFLETEIDQLNELLLRAGFPEGIKSLKETITDLLRDDDEEEAVGE